MTPVNKDVCPHYGNKECPYANLIEEDRQTLKTLQASLQQDLVASAIRDSQMKTLLELTKKLSDAVLGDARPEGSILYRLALTEGQIAMLIKQQVEDEIAAQEAAKQLLLAKKEADEKAIELAQQNISRRHAYLLVIVTFILGRFSDVIFHLIGWSK